MGEVDHVRKPGGKSRATQSGGPEPSAHGGGRGAPAPAWLGGPVAAPFALGGVQRKVAIGASNDRYEREADRTADRVAGGGRVAPGAISTIAPAGVTPAVGQRQAKPEEKPKEKPAAAPVQKAEKPDEKKTAAPPGAVQKQAKPEEKPKEKPAAAPVQKAEKPDDKKKTEAPPGAVQKQAKPEEKPKEKPAAAPVQKAEKPDEKTKTAAPPGAVQKQAKPEEKPKEKPAAAPVQKAEKPDEKTKTATPPGAVQKQAKPEEKPKEKPAAAPVQKAEKPDEKKTTKAPPVQRAVRPEDEKKVERDSSAHVQKQAKPEDKDKKPAAPVQREVKPEDKTKDNKAEPVQREAKPEKKKDEAPVQRADREPPHGDEAVQTSRGAAGGGGGPSMESAASHAIANKGAGSPLNPSTRGTLESGLGADLGDVRVHHDDGARQAADALGARAFTHQNDIWLGAGESQSDTRLMAHEATHVLQQTGSVHRQLVQRDPKPPAGPPGASVTPEQAENDLKTFLLPPIKARHKAVYDQWATSGKLKRNKGYDRGDPDQKDSVWIPAVKDQIKIPEKLHLDPTFKGTKVLTIGNKLEVKGTYDELMRQFAVPKWDRQGKGLKNPLEVDHIVELQVGSWSGGATGDANAIENMELLDKSSNASAGSSTKNNVRDKVKEYLGRKGQPDDAKSVDKYLLDNDLPFDKVQVGGRGGVTESQWWTKTEIVAGKQLQEVEPVKNVGEAGSATSFALLSSGGGMVLGEFHHPKDSLKIAIADEVSARRVAGLKIHSIELAKDFETVKAAGPIGSMQAEWDLPKGVKAPTGVVPIPLIKSAAGQYTGEVASLTPFDVELPSYSPVHFETVGLEGGVVSATGHLKPSIPLLGSAPIEVRMLGKDIEFAYFFKPDEVNLSLPGISIDSVSLGILYGSKGPGVEGGVEFSIKNVGRGVITAKLDGSLNFEATGTFSFDTSLFDKAEVSIWYRKGELGGSGTLAITKPGKIKGVKSATVTFTITGKNFTLTGSVDPSISGVKSAGITVTSNETDGLVIAGTLDLEENPAISSGSIDVKLQKKPGEERWIVSGMGKAAPKTPGVTTTLNVSYEDGLYDASITAAYEKGMLKGSITVGATNRPVGDDGKPAGEPGPKGDKITVYGGGSLTLKLSPWLQATASVQLTPKGEVIVTGEIGLPSSLPIFPEKALHKNIFKIGIDIPIVGVSVAGQRIGIFANITGGLDLGAGIGPGELAELKLGVKYNPAHEEDTQVFGSAKLHIPAHAGLRLFVRGSLGVGIPIVSAQAGIEVGAELGVRGALDAGVKVDWSPKKGLVLDASAEIYAEPVFKFDVTGFVLVEADLVLTTIELYSKRWQLASFEYGSGLRFGLKLPIHYEEGKEFNLSLSDVQFEVPHVDAGEMLKGLIKKIA